MPRSPRWSWRCAAPLHDARRVQEPNPRPWSRHRNCHCLAPDWMEALACLGVRAANGTRFLERGCPAHPGAPASSAVTIRLSLPSSRRSQVVPRASVNARTSAPWLPAVMSRTGRLSIGGTTSHLATPSGVKNPLLAGLRRTSDTSRKGRSEWLRTTYFFGAAAQKTTRAAWAARRSSCSASSRAANFASAACLPRRSSAQKSTGTAAATSAATAPAHSPTLPHCTSSGQIVMLIPSIRGAYAARVKGPPS